MIKGIITITLANLDMLYGPNEQAEIANNVSLVTAPVDSTAISSDLSVLRDVEVIFSGWRAPVMDQLFVEHAPKLRAVFYAGGSIRYFAGDALWARGVRISSAYALNSQSAAFYSVGAILTGLKQAFYYAAYAQKHHSHSPRRPAPGILGSTVGIISLGAAGRAVLRGLGAFDLKAIAYDPYVSTAEAANLGVEMVGLDELFARADAVSMHTPELPETIGLIHGRHFAAMKPGSIFVNTARGGCVREQEMIAELRRRTDLTAILDVTEPDPPLAASPLYSMPNVILTPHIAGALGRECRELGRGMLDEFNRWRKDAPLRWEITREKLAHMA